MTHADLSDLLASFYECFVRELVIVMGFTCQEAGVEDPASKDGHNVCAYMRRENPTGGLW